MWGTHGSPHTPPFPKVLAPPLLFKKVSGEPRSSEILRISSPSFQNPALRNSLSLLPFGQDKLLPSFITVYLYKKSVNLSWVLGG